MSAATRWCVSSGPGGRGFFSRASTRLSSPVWLLLLSLSAPASAQQSAQPPEKAAADQAAQPEVEVITPQQVQRWEMELSSTAQHCRTLVEQELMSECTKLLDEFEARLPKTDREEVNQLRQHLDVRRQLIKDTQALPALDAEHPEVHYTALFKMYAAVPEQFFPFDEVMQAWQTWQLSEDAQRRFGKYKTVRVIARATNEDATLEALFYQNIQQRFLDYGFKLVDLSTTAPKGQQETLVKLSLSGKELDQVADAALGQGNYELAGDITSLRYTGPNGVRLPPRTWKMVETSADIEMARAAAVKRLAPQVADAVFYLTLKQMFLS